MKDYSIIFLVISILNLFTIIHLKHEARVINSISSELIKLQQKKIEHLEQIINNKG